jgi:UDP-N-acetylglucosamine--N-acetylmuramyl-(pentapeptide) pyrophosphoryl-undecaprenol N-acetylglucosamine transferase
MTGGGTAGHVTPNLAIADAIKEATSKSEIYYFGSYNGLEKELAKRAGFKFTGISTGKLRRYFDLQNFLDLGRIPLGFFQAFKELGKVQPRVVFSKGGFVAVPVVLAARARGIPVITHESDSIPGLATKISAPFAKKILLAYEEAAEYLPKYKKKIKVVGNPVRSDLFKGSAARAKKITGFKRQVLLVVGGSTGSMELNNLLLKEKEKLIKDFDIVHITGDKKGHAKKEAHNYSLPYLHDEMKDFLALASLALSRAGASACAEFESLGIPTLLFPLGLNASRGDQISNAKAMAKKHDFMRLYNPREELFKQLHMLPKRKKTLNKNSAAKKIAALILDQCK